MAAFYSQHHSLPLDSAFLFPNNSSNSKVSVSPEEPNIGNLINNYFPHFNPPLRNTIDLDQQITSGQISTDSSTVVDRLEAGEQVTQKLNSMEKKRKIISSNNSAQFKDKIESKIRKKQKKAQSEMKGEDEKFEAKNADKKGQRKVLDEEASKGYIHVRARRGQATDSHSLAERVRREKISERMRILQGLVPGCDKVTGKALMLDEIINYVQSLQNQVEFLSMKLASVNPFFYDFGMDAFMVRPEVLNSLESPLPCLQQYSSPNQSTALPDATTRTTLPSPTPNNFPLIDTSAASFLLQQGQRLINANIPHQDNGSVFWDVDEQRQKLVNTSGLGNNLCSNFH